ncbi:hypothetical protein TEQG_07354 [Trichophyton equinum CBS 127.97]|uniref:Uncharacterized protein n=1 Tax=Trichophyton equinum (strain ATCC MYA-4606 / CBS 127.97) TaxID=559882 RepID=F2Q2V0_TRIEC|nr:hypothetical protein TEQG_07354 [Trichophyton equinum CBS 127.97]
MPSEAMLALRRIWTRDYLRGLNARSNPLIQVLPEGTCGDCRQAGRRCEPLDETSDVCRFIHLRMAVFGLQGAGWSVAPAMIEELKELYDKIMEDAQYAIKTCLATRLDREYLSQTCAAAGLLWKT